MAIAGRYTVRDFDGEALLSGERSALLGRFSYDLFAGVPLFKPVGFHTVGATAGFSVNLEL